MTLQDYYNQFANFIAVTLGTLLQLLLAPKAPVRLVLLTIISSIVTALYIVMPLVDYLHITNDKIEAGFYAMSSIISLTLIRLIINTLPTALKLKALNLLGVDYDKYKQEMQTD